MNRPATTNGVLQAFRDRHRSPIIRVYLDRYGAVSRAVAPAQPRPVDGRHDRRGLRSRIRDQRRRVPAARPAGQEDATGAWDDVVMGEFRRRIPFWSLLIGIWLSLGYWPMPPKWFVLGNNVVKALGILSVTIALAAIAAPADRGARSAVGAGRAGPRARPQHRADGHLRRRVARRPPWPRRQHHAGARRPRRRRPGGRARAPGSAVESVRRHRSSPSPARSESATTSASTAASRGTSQDFNWHSTQDSGALRQHHHRAQRQSLPGDRDQLQPADA